MHRRQAECAKTARIQMALPPGGKTAPAVAPGANLYEELGDSSMWVNPDPSSSTSHPTCSRPTPLLLLCRFPSLKFLLSCLNASTPPLVFSCFRHQLLSSIYNHFPFAFLKWLLAALHVDADSHLLLERYSSLHQWIALYLRFLAIIHFKCQQAMVCAAAQLGIVLELIHELCLCMLFVKHLCLVFIECIVYW